MPYSTPSAFGIGPAALHLNFSDIAYAPVADDDSDDEAPLMMAPRRAVHAPALRTTGRSASYSWVEDTHSWGRFDDVFAREEESWSSGSSSDDEFFQ